MKENNNILDQQLVKMKQQVEQLQAELTDKNSELQNQGKFHHNIYNKILTKIQN
jgi:hypothetical protein